MTLQPRSSAFFDNVAADISGGAGNQNRFHGSFLLRFFRAVGPQFIQALQPQVVQQQCAGLLFYGAWLRAKDPAAGAG